MSNYYGCDGKHTEFTCLSAYYVGPKRWKTYANWCASCKEKYSDPKGT